MLKIFMFTILISVFPLKLKVRIWIIFLRRNGFIPKIGRNSISALMKKKLIEEAGRLNVPGRPNLYCTTPNFLRTFGISTLEELPPIEKVSFGEPEIVEEMEQQTIEEPVAVQEEA